MMTTIGNIRQVWERRVSLWPRIKSPLRPSDGDIAVYESLGGGNLSKSVLILGATPEMRDLVASKGGRATVVDISRAVLNGMSKFLKIAGPENETLIEADWCRFNLQKNSFDAIIGDLVLWLLPVLKQKKLIKRISYLLSPNGLFVTRVRIWDKNQPKKSPEDVITRYLHFLEKNPHKRSEVLNTLFLNLADATGRLGKGQIKKKKVVAYLLDFLDGYRNDNRFKHFILSAAKSWGLGANLTWQTLQELLIILQANLILEGKAHADDYLEAEKFPILSLRKHDF